MIAGALFAQQGAPPDADAPPDEPGRPVARISVMSGDASVKRADSGEWVAAALNAPLLAGDSVSVAAGGAVEVQFDRSNFARMAGDSEMRISELDNGRQQIQLARGLITWRVLREETAQTEISTPAAAVRPGQNASVRVEVAPDGTSRITVRHGDAEVYSQRGTERVREGDSMVVRGDSDAQLTYAAARDQWDNWNDERDNYLQRAQSPRYVSQDMYGTEDLDSYGRWDYDPAYGNVWSPNVAASWAPYRDGHWVWEPFYGWTWVDYSPWGWAPFHYGSWYYRTNFGWSWFPGHRYERVWWRPALVGFVGFGGRGSFGVGFGFGNVGWVPLAPYERFRPWYGRGGFGGRNTAFTNINITNVYRNSRFNGGVTAVTASDFQRGNFRNHVAVDASHLQQGGVARGGLPYTGGSQATRFTERAPSAAAPRADFSGQRFYSRGFSGGSQAQNIRTAPGAATPRMTSNPSWQRFGSAQPAQSQSQAPASRGFYSAPRQVQVAPPIVHERQAGPGESRGSFGSPYGYNGGSSRANGGGGYSSPAPQYRSEPRSEPRSAPSPSFRSAPSAAPAPRGGGERGGGGGGSHGGGERGRR